MANYRIYMRSFAPWREFGAAPFFKEPSTVHVPVPRTGSGFYPAPSTAAITFGGPFHGDGRGFSLDTSSPGVTARVNAYLEVNLSTASEVEHRAWCDTSSGPWMGIGPSSRATGTTKARFSVYKDGQSLKAVIDYGASNPLVKGAPDIDARGEFTLKPGSGDLTIDAIISGDQFPACESFIQDPRGNKIFLGGFAPGNKGQLARLYGLMNKPLEVWFESHIVVNVDSSGAFRDLQGGGSGSNSTGPSCEQLTLSFNNWNARIMGSILMPSDAP